MISPANDNLFYAGTLCKVAHYKEALQYLSLYLDEDKPTTDLDFETINIICKATVDPIRNSLRILMDSYANEVDMVHALNAEMIQHFKEKTHSQLTEYCHFIINMITEKLLPKATTPKDKVFCQKMRGDYYRYLAEFASQKDLQSIITEAHKAYLEAVESSQYLLHSEPMKLGLLLNYAIFIFEHLKNTAEAAEMLRKARREAEIDMGQLDQNAHNESLEILQAMRTNLIVWFDDDTESEKTL
ncbi:14-3-3 protein [Histomonas meleagridis]|uniref:14-3-3 protein n=1 Tax=Histomonas meleagridis TaxID=135588 RepID=UPI003559AEC4|nr:14-3-3 protein [Histomonas meleagridis]KAH0804903.1 14-3-3 protein [Histomonas meleagridis]